MAEYIVKRYSDEMEDRWDHFVMEESANGTFLQTRRFLNYHPKHRFKDCSLMIFNEKKKLIAVCPACEQEENGNRIFFSHKGSTFGGIIVAEKIYKVHYVLPLVSEIEEYLKKQSYNEVYYKITPNIFSSKATALLEYALYFSGYDDFKELSTFVDFDEYKEDILSNFSQGKRTHVHNCENIGIKARVITSDYEIDIFYQILCENLKKYNTKPVHTLEELIDFKNSTLMDETLFLGVYKEDEMIAGGMIFLFNNVKVAHTQYLCAKSEYNVLSPMTYLYYSVIDEMRKRGYRKVSWGIATEDMGKYINEGLITSKESYGSTYANNLTFHKLLD